MVERRWTLPASPASSIAKESIFSDLNNLGVDTPLDTYLAGYLTTDDVEEPVMTQSSRMDASGMVSRSAGRTLQS